MKVKQFQFQRGMSMSEFFHHYGTEAQCEAALEKMRWPDGFKCPKCEKTSHCVVWHRKVKTFQCNRCHAQVTLTGGTIFHSTKLPLTKWFQAIYKLTENKNNVSGLELMRTLGVSYRTAWRVKQKLMQVMYEREQETKLSGHVTADDAYLGGERKGGKRGRGSENKVPFIAAVQQNEHGHPTYMLLTPVKAFKAKEIKAWAKQYVVPGTTVVTDGLKCFKAVTKAGCIHDPQIVGKDRKSTSMFCFNWVNTVLGNVKNALHGTYHAINDKHLPRYLAEFCYRFNRREDADVFIETVRRLCGFPPLTYSALISEKA